MLIDKYRTLIMEHSSWEGNRGDSCAETSRYAHLKMLLGDYNLMDIDLSAFDCDTGWVRHPDLEYFRDSKNESWGASDMTSDQMLPLYLTSRRAGLGQTTGIERCIKRDWYRTGNGDLITPGFWAELHDASFDRAVFELAQIGLFKFKYRWNDGTNKFEETENSACDYLNFIHVAVYGPKWVRKLVDKQTLKDKVQTYYQNELLYEVKYNPSGKCNELVELYNKTIDRYWV